MANIAYDFSNVTQFQGPVPQLTPAYLGVDTFSRDGNRVRDWTKAKSQGSISFAIFAANWGVFPGGYFKREWPRMKDAGLVRGAYVFLRFPNPKADKRYGPCPSPVDQAKTFIQTVGKLEKSDLPPTLDVEFPDGRAATGLAARQCLDRVRAAWKVLKDFYGVAPIIYTSARVWQQDLNNLAAPDLVESPLWLAKYWANPRRVAPRKPPKAGTLNPPVPPPWGDATNWWIHQYQGDALKFPGFATGDVDLNRFHTVVKGAKGDQVKWVQRRLGIAQSGQFDAATGSALAAFQNKSGLPATQIVDPATFAFLCWSK